MKEKYISPELELQCLAPAEALANGMIDFGAMGNGSGLPNGTATPVSQFDPNNDVWVPNQG